MNHWQILYLHFNNFFCYCINLNSYREKSFTYGAPTECNKLPLEIKSAPSIEYSKSSLKTYLFKNILSRFESKDYILNRESHFAGMSVCLLSYCEYCQCIYLILGMYAKGQIFYDSYTL